jgi:hypothetical protein
MTGNPREFPARRGFSVSCRGKTLLSRIDPIAQAERLAAECPVKERTLYLCPSPLYGYGLPALLERLGAGRPDSAILCVEADEALFEISRKAFGENPALLPPPSAGGFRPLALTKASAPEALCAFARETWGERVFRRVEVLRLTGGWQLFPRLYEGFARALRREIMVEWGNAMTLIRLGRLYTRNLIRNLSLLAASGDVSALDAGPSPVLALGAGPSLDPVLDEISALSGGRIPGPGKRPYKIACVDTCLPALHERGITPDIAVILESQHWNLRDFAGARGREIDAALDLSALPASARVLGGKRFFFATPWAGLRLWGRLEEAGILPETFAPLGSVGLSAVALALRIGSGPVFTAGIDFSFTLDAYHARSTPGRGDAERKQNRFRSIINAGAAFREGAFAAVSKAGLPVRSDPAMRNYRNLFEREFGGNPRLADISGSGLPLGVKTVSPAEAFAALNGTGAEGEGRVRPPPRARAGGAGARGMAERTAAFIRGETESLAELKETLTGANPAGPGRLEELLDACDYLWAHFPDCAGAGGRRPAGTDVGFLKRVRTEIEPFQKLWETALAETGNEAEPPPFPGGETPGPGAARPRTAPAEPRS